MDAQPQSRSGLSIICFVVRWLMVVAFLSVTGSLTIGQDKEPPRISRPVRVLTIQGQVSLPEGMPVGHAIVTLTSSSGVPRQAYTTEQGRFEFQDIPEGGYSLTAASLTDSTLASERVETDASHTATGNLTVNLILRKATHSGRIPKPAVVSVAEADQKVPKESRKAFTDAIKLRGSNQNEKALQSLNRAIELYPDYFQALSERGDLYILQRRLEDAEKDFERAVRINSRYGRALRGAGYCKLEKREFEEAIKYLERSITVQPENGNAYLLLGIAYLETDRREEAKAALLRALSFNTTRELRAHIHLGNLYARQRMYLEAADELRKYLEANPTDPDAADLKNIEAQWRARAAAP